MTDIGEIQFWPALAGLGLFLFGMFMLEEALKNLAGRSFKLFLRKHTGNPIKAVFSGALVTAVLQSSSLVTLLVMSLAGAGIIGLNSGIGMIMGANLGTTATGWLVSLLGFKMDIEALILPFLAAGGLGIAFIKNERWANFSKLLMGFSFMFWGLNYMKTAFEHLATQVDFTYFQNLPMLLLVVFGFVLTALIQSSSASMTIYLSSLAAGIISLPQAAFLLIGSDLGTTVTGMIGSLSGNAIRKKVGRSQFLFNLINALLALLIISPLFYLIEHVFKVADPLIALVVFHSLFNLAGILLVLPFLNLFTRLLEKYTGAGEQTISKYIALADPAESISALESLEKETVLFIGMVKKFNVAAFATGTGNTAFLQNYLKIKQYENEISRFYISLQQISLTEAETVKINHLVAAVRNAALSAKDLKDIKHNLVDFENATSHNAEKILGRIKENQQRLYEQLNVLYKKLKNVRENDLDSLNALQDKMYHEETEDLYSLFAVNEQELDTPSGLNMLREINRSNESLIKAFRNLVSKS